MRDTDNKRLNSKISRRSYLGTASSILFSAIAVMSLPKRINADIPSILNIEYIPFGSLWKLRVQFSHANPSNTHYIDKVEIDVDGKITEFHPCYCKQESDPFTFDFPIGEIEEDTTVRVRPHCIEHGWGNWSNQIQVPEFPTSAIVSFAILIALIFTIIGKRGKKKK